MDFGYPPDDFQRDSYKSIDANRNILVTAHTGSGKTNIAKYAIAHMLKLNKKVAYTSPIKTLSNQKYKEFKENFEDKLQLGTVGILTGDVKLKPDASCLIMTTEILRNALYRHYGNDKLEGKLEVERVVPTDFISNLGCVIFDEVHYINDKDRGTVWEETLIMLDKSILLILLSATISKPENFSSWLANIKQRPIDLITTNNRIIPLEHSVFINDELIPIMDNNDVVHRQNLDRASKLYVRNSTTFSLIQNLTQQLKDKNMVPVIYFVFSRANCARFANALSICFNTTSEQAEIEHLFRKYTYQYHGKYDKMDQYNEIYKLMLSGIAYHHSGLLPILKELIEIMFQRNYIKVLFATETFAVGVNMPTKTVVMTDISKPTEEGYRYLLSSEYKQMAGRAGRRGMDKKGNVIILPLYDFNRASVYSVISGSYPYIQSKFMVKYNFILKVILNGGHINNFTNDTLCSVEAKQQQQLLLSDIETIKNQLVFNKLNEELDSYQVYKVYDDFQKKENELLNMGLSLSKKQLKEKFNIQKKIKFIPKQEFDKIVKYTQLKNNILKKEAEYDASTKLWEPDIYKSLNIMYKLGYLLEPKLGCEYMTLKALIASQINDVSPILLTEMLCDKVFDGLTPQEIVGILGIFIKEHREEEYKFDGTPVIKERVEQVKEIINKIETIEKIYNITSTDLDISFDFIDVAYEWSNGKEINDLLTDKLMEGNFIKGILKINNIVNSLKSISIVSGEISTIPALYEIEKLLIRDIVSVDSLYIV